MKKLGMLLVAVAIGMFSFVGCGGTKTTKTEQTKTKTEQTKSPESEKTKPADTEKTKTE